MNADNLINFYARSDVYSPEVEALNDGMVCNAEGHVFGCPGAAGGDHVIDRERCYWCRRDVTNYPSVNVSLSDGRIVACCDVCWERGDEGIDLPLDMTDE